MNGKAQPRHPFDLNTIEEVEAMHESTIIGGLKRDEWLRRARLPLRHLRPEDVPLLDLDSMDDAAEILVRDEDGELFKRNPITGRLKSAHGALDGKGGIAWDYA